MATDAFGGRHPFTSLAICSVLLILFFIMWLCLLSLKDTYRFFVDGQSCLEVDNAYTDTVC